MTIDDEAFIDPPPAVDAETLAAYLHQHARTAAQRTAALEAKLHAEEAAEAAAHAETDMLRAELQQYRGWINEEIEGGHAFRLSKSLHEERERRGEIEQQVASLKTKFSLLAGELKEMMRKITAETPEQHQIRAADEALSALEKLKRISEQGKDEGEHMAALAALTQNAQSRAPVGGYY